MFQRAIKLKLKTQPQKSHEPIMTDFLHALEANILTTLEGLTIFDASSCNRKISSSTSPHPNCVLPDIGILLRYKPVSPPADSRVLKFQQSKFLVLNSDLQF